MKSICYTVYTGLPANILYLVGASTAVILCPVQYQYSTCYPSENTVQLGVSSTTISLQYVQGTSSGPCYVYVCAYQCSFDLMAFSAAVLLLRFCS